MELHSTEYANFLILFKIGDPKEGLQDCDKKNKLELEMQRLYNLTVQDREKWC